MAWGCRAYASVCPSVCSYPVQEENTLPKGFSLSLFLVQSALVPRLFKILLLLFQLWVEWMCGGSSYCLGCVTAPGARSSPIPAFSLSLSCWGWSKLFSPAFPTMSHVSRSCSRADAVHISALQTRSCLHSLPCRSHSDPLPMPEGSSPDWQTQRSGHFDPVCCSCSHLFVSPFSSFPSI